MNQTTQSLRRIFQALTALSVTTVGVQAEGSPLVDIYPDSGIEFQHFNGMTGKTYFAEMMGAGAALFDFDNDGDMDLYLVQGNMLGEGDPASALIPSDGKSLTDRLFRNDMVAGKPETMKFVDVTDEMQISSHGYGMGVATGDVNNDGLTDLYITNFGENALLLNRGDHFEDVTEAAGVGDDRWSITASLTDHDGDGWLDLLVVNYVNFKLEGAKTCRSHFDAPDYCSPQSYEPVSDRLFGNRGDGTFADLSAASGIGTLERPGLGVVAADFNGDNRVDYYVANDGAANSLWLNQGKNRFVDDALLAGVAVDMAGNPQASMGVDAADFDRDGDLDLFMTHLNRQTNTLYVNDGAGWFQDRSTSGDLGRTSFPYTGFGTRWIDVNNDGRLDLFSANGAVVKEEAQVAAGEPLPLRQRNQLWFGDGAAGFRIADPGDGSPLAESAVSRGAAFGDLDNDGDLDIVVTNNASTPQVLRNDHPQVGGWIGLRVMEGSRDALGALVKLGNESGPARRVASDGSYVSASDPRVVFAGIEANPVSVHVTWPDGHTRLVENLTPGQYHTITRK